MEYAWSHEIFLLKKKVHTEIKFGFWVKFIHRLFDQIRVEFVANN